MQIQADLGSHRVPQIEIATQLNGGLILSAACTTRGCVARPPPTSRWARHVECDGGQTHHAAGAREPLGGVALGHHDGGAQGGSQHEGGHDLRATSACESIDIIIGNHGVHSRAAMWQTITSYP